MTDISYYTVVIATKNSIVADALWLGHMIQTTEQVVAGKYSTAIICVGEPLVDIPERGDLSKMGKKSDNHQQQLAGCEYPPVGYIAAWM